MRKTIAIISFVLSMFMGVSFLAPESANAETYLNVYVDNANHTLRAADINLDGKLINSDVPAVTYQSRSLIPLRALGEAMGAKIDWDAPSMTATMTLNGKSVSMTINSNVATVNGVKKNISYNMPAKLMNKRTMIPVRFIAEEFNCSVDWDAPNYRVNVYSKQVAYNPPASPTVGNAPTVVIDAGHGGADSGAISYSAKHGGPTPYYEKDIALNVSKKLEKMLRDKGYNVVMTRTGDYFVGLSERATISDNNGGDIFVSIHFNAAEATSATGLETFYFPGSGEGGRLASNIQSELVASVGGVDRGVKTAKFTVLSETGCIAVLTELGFITNPYDEARLGSDQYHYESALAISRGIDKYFGR